MPLLDWKFITDFLVVYRYFTSPQDLVRKLLSKYNSKAQTKTDKAVAVRYV